MARMHSRKRGKSGSSKPAKKSVPSWVSYKPKDTELLIAKLAKDGRTASSIGVTLRDTYGIPDVKTLCGARITGIMGKKNLASEIPEDLNSLIKRLAAIRKHVDSHKKDETAKRGMQLTQSLINKLVKYYKKTGKLADNWKL